MKISFQRVKVMADLLWLRETLLFNDMSVAETEDALRNLHADEKNYRKGQVILHAGKRTDQLGLVLEGGVSIESNDFWGNRTILSHVGPKQVFAETYAFLRSEAMLVDVVANEKCRILFLDLRGLPESGALEGWQGKLIRNLLMISSQKNYHLSGRSFHAAPKSIRGRVMAYLNTVALQKKRTSFEIPFDRQQLADYLNVERSALSKELGKMQRDGIIRTQKNHFEII